MMHFSSNMESQGHWSLETLNVSAWMRFIYLGQSRRGLDMLEEYASVSLDAGVRFQFGTGASALTSRTKLTQVIWRSREFGFSH